MKDLKPFGTFATAGVWGTGGVILLLLVVRALYLGLKPEATLVVWLVIAFGTVIGTLLGEKTKLITGWAWFAAAAIGFILFGVSVRLNLGGLMDTALKMLFGGLITARLTFIGYSKD